MTSILTRSHPTRTAKGSRRAASRRSAQPGPVFLGLLAIIIGLSFLGVVMVLSASSVTALDEYGDSWHFFRRQAMWLCIGLAAMVVTTVVDYRMWARIAKPLLLVCVALLCIVLIPQFGRNINGSSRWIAVGGFTFQPSEIVKLALIVFVADLLAKPSRPIEDLKGTVAPVLLWLGGVALLVVLEPDLGTAIISAIIVFAMLNAAGLSKTVLAGLATLGTLGAGLFAFTSSYRRERIFAFRDPWADELDTGFQNLQSLVAISNGGITGTGLGASRGKWGFLPYAHNDFIFAIVAEELGLIGGVVVVLSFLGFAIAGLIVAARVRDRFGSLLAVGITTWIVVQAFVNIGVVIGALPVTGVTLPFMSLGGTSLVLTLAACGMLLNVAREA